MFQRYHRSEQAFILAMIELAINEVSTLKIENMTEELCKISFTKSTVSNLYKQLKSIIKVFHNRILEKHYPFFIIDKIYLKIRENGWVRSKRLLIAKAINESGHRKIIGFQVANSASWSDFFSYLKARGLADV